MFLTIKPYFHVAARPPVASFGLRNHVECGRPAALRGATNAKIEHVLEFALGDLQLFRSYTAETGKLSRAVGADVMNDIVLCGSIAGGRAGEVGVFMYN